MSPCHICLPRPPLFPIVVKHKLYVDFIQYEYMDLPDISSKRDMSTNFYLKLIEPSARPVFIFWTLVEREEWGGVSEERKREHESNLARLKTAPELLTQNISSRRLYKLQAKTLVDTLCTKKYSNSQISQYPLFIQSITALYNRRHLASHTQKHVTFLSHPVLLLLLASSYVWLWWWQGAVGGRLSNL